MYKLELNKLAGLMKEKGYTQQDIAKEVRRGASYVSDKMRGLSPFNMFDVYIICDLLEIKHDRITEYFPRLNWGRKEIKKPRSGKKERIA